MFGAIPPAISYPMPAAHELPVDVTDWSVDPSRSMLLIHDMQNYFLRPLVAGGGSPYSELVANIALLRDECLRAGVPIAYTAQPGGMSPDERGLLKDIWGAGMSTDDEDRAIVSELSPVPGNYVFTKWRYSAFHESDLSARLQQTKRDQLIITGVYAHVGVLVTACESFSRDIETFVAADGIADFSLDDHRMALEYAAARCATVRSSAALVEELRTSDVRAGV